MLHAARTHLARRSLASTLRPHRSLLPLLPCSSSSSSPTPAAHRAPAYRLDCDLSARTALEARRTFSSTTTPRAPSLKPFVLADIGEGITEVEVVKWLVKAGDTVEEFDPIVEVMSDKASVEITSPYSGKVAELSGAAGDMLRVGNTLCTIEVEGEGGASEEGTAVASKAAANEPAAAPSAAPSSSSSSSATPPPSMDGPLEPVDRSDTVPEQAAAEILATPGTRRFAREHGVDLARLRGTGKHGRVTKDDVWAFVNGSSDSTTSPSASTASAPRAAAPATAAPSSAPAASSDSTSVPLSATRRAMFRAMTASNSIPHFAYSDTLDVTELERLRRSLSSSIPLPLRKALSPAEEATLARQAHWSGGGDAAALRVDEGKRIDRVTLLPLLLKALSLALVEHPLFLHTLAAPSSTSPEPALTRRQSHDISVALSSPSPAGGLFTPVLRDVQGSSVFALASQLAGLQGCLSSTSSSNGAPRFPPEHSGAGTLTLSNVGVVGGRGTHPVIPPTGQLAIGAVGRVRVEPRFKPGKEEERAKRVAQGVEEEVDGGGEWKVEPRLVLDATFTADHRVVEGVELARLVETWKRIVEEPSRLLGQ
ncbi:2-oxoacid dehydrogenases acyltransferase-domain-containing protein [Rhodotorula diobovata]|uniref:Dihydrolipoamide acetyltransferase component of pyruvate dehydrogenase complex n=3 Tax=Rhodotorula diobovata TaxID=5288 RepID=A0A5C5FJ85_9BASI|nr:2-oxoacid dehydrogenases acyltransferase-domain-containing protein [Rhodotorula diobovata]